MPSEFDLIRRHFSPPVPATTLGGGDDCALFAPPAGMQVATSTDLLVEGRHFFADVAPEALGHKALAVNLSDLAAMGAQPLGCLLALALPAARAQDAWLAAFARGFLALAERCHCPLLGGDTTKSDAGLVISVTVFGAVAPEQALRRDAARAGDDVWVSGHLGAAAAALALLQGRWQRDEPIDEPTGDPTEPDTLAALRPALERPEPALVLGQALRGIAHAAIDISDGLLQDLGHVLTASGCGAVLDESALPVAPALQHWPRARIRAMALGGGDVYQLCFTAPPSARAAVQAASRATATPVTRIGHTTAEPGLTVRDASGQPLTDLPPGFDHFRTGSPTRAPRNTP